MKRCLSVILTIALIFMFTACTNPKGQQDGTTASSEVSEAGSNEQAGGLVTNNDTMLMYGKEASNRKQEIDRQHYTIPNQRPKDKHFEKI